MIKLSLVDDYIDEAISEKPPKDGDITNPVYQNKIINVILDRADGSFTEREIAKALYKRTEQPY